MKKIVLAGGCFWGLEELIRVRPGVTNTEVGYTGGSVERPTYENHTGHAEAVEVTFDPSQTDEGALLDYFFTIHDPTTVNRQGNDIGDSYRSAIFYDGDEQHMVIEAAIKRNQAFWERPIVTAVEPLGQFWPAEDYHQDYLQKNPGGYSCHYERPRP